MSGDFERPEIKSCVIGVLYPFFFACMHGIKHSLAVVLDSYTLKFTRYHLGNTSIKEK
jgi:hypothetical protein